jgi:RNA polymerase sigma factor (sigma-70 family)
MRAETDGQLVARCRDGDVTAFEALVTRHRRTVVSQAWRTLGRLAEAEDIAQEAFIAAFLRILQLRDPDRFLPWLRSITQRLCLTQVRSRREEPTEDCEMERHVSQMQPSHDGFEDLVGDLPEPMLVALRLVYEQGYTCAEAAGILGVREGTVRSRLSRARALLRKGLDAMETSKPNAEFANKVVVGLVDKAREMIESGDYETAVQTLDEALDTQFENGEKFSEQAVKMVESAWEQLRRRDAEANARLYGKALDELDWRVARFDTLSCSLEMPGGEGNDLWGVPHDMFWNRVIDARDVCRRLLVSPVTLCEWVRKGMPVIRYRPWVRFDLDLARKWLAEQGIEVVQEVSLAQASHILSFLFGEIEAGQLTAQGAEDVVRELDAAYM